MARGRRVPSVPRRSAAEVELMREDGRIVARALAAVAEAAAPGVSTAELDRIAETVIRAGGAIPSFKDYRGYPASICVEPDDIVVHGIPAEDVILRSGQILGVDVGAEYQGYHGDAAVTVAIGDVSAAQIALMQATREALECGIAEARAGNVLRDVCGAIQRHVEGAGYSSVRDLVGHGIGQHMHEAPQVPNFVDEGHFPEYELLLRPGHALAIEPMVNMGRWQVTQDADGWTVRTADGLPSAHFEHTVIVQKGEPIIMTLP
jgi:methionyl aminopeptidase